MWRLKGCVCFWALLTALPVVLSLTLSHLDLENPNKSCDGWASCGPQAKSPDYVHWMERNCFCDRDCAMYGDCCVDSPYYVSSSEQRRGLATFQCVPLKQYSGVYMITTCPPEWSDVTIRERCEGEFDKSSARRKEDIQDILEKHSVKLVRGKREEDLVRLVCEPCLIQAVEDEELCSKCERVMRHSQGMSAKDPMSDIPVTSIQTNLTYRNSFCAICHGDFKQDTSVLWQPRLECPNVDDDSNLTRQMVNDKLVYHPVFHVWGLNLTKEEAGDSGEDSREVRPKKAVPSTTVAPVRNSPLRSLAELRDRRNLVKNLHFPNRTSFQRSRAILNVTPKTEFKQNNATNLTASPAKVDDSRKKRTFFACHVDPVLPETVSRMVRRCSPDVIKSCATKWTNVDIRNRCEAYTLTMYEGSNSYRNPHCAICNNVPIQNLECMSPLNTLRSFSGKEFSPKAFSVLFDFNTNKRNGYTEVGKKIMCSDTELYDPFFKKCRNVFDIDSSMDDRDNLVEIEIEGGNVTKKSSQIYESDHIDHNYSQHHLYNFSKDFLTCRKIILDPDDFSLEDNNQTIFIEKYKKKYETADFRILSNGYLEICADHVVEYVDKFGIYMGYITFVGLGVSIAFLILHLMAFCVVKDLRNLSGKNLASFCVSLLCAYSAFLIGQMPIDRTACKFVGFFTYYFFLGSFFWMLTISFDIFRTLRLATSELRVSLGSQFKKFMAYSIFAWVCPFILLSAAVALEVTEHEYGPGFGNGICWFSNKKSLLVLFVAPIGVIMTLNVVFFCFSAHMIYSTRHCTLSRAVASSTSRTREDFKLYIRLSLVMGLTWVIGLVAGYLDVEILWYIFIGLNTLQGLFIFLAFTCNEKVVRGVRHLLRPARRGSSATDRGKRGPPSYSWSGVSSLTPHSDDTRKSEISPPVSHSNPDTLY